MLRHKIYQSFVDLSSSRLVASCIRRFTCSRLSRPLIRSFAATYNINTEEAEKPLSQYQSLQSYFCRKLKEDVRPLPTAPGAVISPVDGLLGGTGTITPDASFHIKGQAYPLDELLGSKKLAEQFKGGRYMIFYLAPGDYHRIHAPFDCHVLSRWALGKGSAPVNELGLKLGKRPLSTNYRLLTYLERAGQNAVLAKVGALNVNAVHPTHLRTSWKKGEEVGFFSFGSTVILLTEADMLKDTSSQAGEHVKMGEAVAAFSKK
ncbi:phosphatidylserine decarboxylase [Salsuginibacillus kocurii]|uniref:phosphatidylserine decarboxylase n=1 Tax=Salsuginibacillus kocurii TaxID=427078 RepID=UPI000372FFD2|nr:phosphatidylserine decarboxylase [Salsuginibacillus kocurii]